MSLPVYRKDKRLTNGKRIIRACYIILAFLAVFIFRNVSPWSIASRDIPTETDAAVSKNPRKRKPLSSDSDMESIFRVSKSDAFDAFPESLDASMSGVSTSAALTHTNNPDAMLDCIFFTSGDKDVRVSVAKLFDAFSTVAEENKWPYWIAHQDLLAWHWNKRSFTMNPSVSIQIPSRLVPHLLKYENEMIFHRFRIIVNPNHYLLDSQPPKSGIDIDAVFLDTKTGLEIQIHALYKTSTNGMLKTLNGFVYHSSDIFPLRKSEFNNHSVWIPNEPERILLFEYGKNSLYTRYHLVRFLKFFTLLEVFLNHPSSGVVELQV